MEAGKASRSVGTQELDRIAEAASAHADGVDGPVLVAAESHPGLAAWVIVESNEWESGLA